MSGAPAPPFAHGVASFDPTATGVLLWTRVDPRTAAVGGPTPAEVGWYVSREPSGPAVAAGTAAIPADTDGCVCVEVSGLEPATTYHYRFELGGERSPVGRTRTLPDGPTDWLRLAVVCCADRSMGTLDAYRAIAEEEVDLVLHLGDYLYESAKGPHPVDPEGTCVTLEDYRRRHAHTRLDRDLQAMHLRHPVVFVWDDHDVADNAWRHGAKAHDPDGQGPWEDRLAGAAQARQEWLPARLPDPRDPLAMWRSFALGDLAELVVLDTRIPGRDRQFGDDGAKALDDPGRQLLEPAQRRWAHERVRDRSRRWCLLASQVPVSDLELPVPPLLGRLLDEVLPSGYRVVDGEACCTDLWEGYPAERAALAEAIADRGDGVVILSGDVHSNWVTTLCADDGRPLAGELVVTSVSSTPMGDQLPPGWRTQAERVADDVPHVTWHDLEHHGYLYVDVRPDGLRADYYAVEPGADRPERLSSWTVGRIGPPRWREAQPDSPAGSFADAVRPGLPLDELPPRQEADPAGRAGRVARRAGAALAAAVVSLAGVLLVRRAARRAC